MKNEFITEAEVIRKLTGTSVGNAISFTVATGFAADSIGWKGSSRCDVCQVMTARTETIATGASTITAATAVERSQSGMYLARVFEARYFQANTPTNTITGATMISINCVDCTMSDSSS